jgi:hypothetical protein
MIFSAEANTIYTLSLYYFIPYSYSSNDFTLSEGTSLLSPVSRTIDITLRGVWNGEITVTTSAGQLVSNLVLNNMYTCLPQIPGTLKYLYMNITSMVFI